jgi:hypothetical protein
MLQRSSKVEEFARSPNDDGAIPHPTRHPPK